MIYAHLPPVSRTKCWACSTKHPQVSFRLSYLFEQQANKSRFIQIPVWEQAGLFTFNYKGTNNTIPLCGSRHTEFDMSLDPGYVFFSHRHTVLHRF